MPAPTSIPAAGVRPGGRDTTPKGKAAAPQSYRLTEKNIAALTGNVPSRPRERSAGRRSNGSGEFTRCVGLRRDYPTLLAAPALRLPAHG